MTITPTTESLLHALRQTTELGAMDYGHICARVKQHDELVAALLSATVMLEKIETHCVNKQGLRGIYHAVDGRRGRAAMQALIPELRAALAKAQS